MDEIDDESKDESEDSDDVFNEVIELSPSPYKRISMKYKGLLSTVKEEKSFLNSPGQQTLGFE